MLESRRTPLAVRALIAVALAAVGVLGLAGHAARGQRVAEPQVSAATASADTAATAARGQARHGAPQPGHHTSAAADVQPVRLDLPGAGSAQIDATLAPAPTLRQASSTSRGPPAGH